MSLDAEYKAETNVAAVIDDVVRYNSASITFSYKDLPRSTVWNYFGVFWKLLGILTNLNRHTSAPAHASASILSFFQKSVDPQP